MARTRSTKGIAPSEVIEIGVILVIVPGKCSTLLDCCAFSWHTCAMPVTIYALPDPGTPTAETTPVPAESGWADIVTGWTTAIPSWIWATTLAVTFTATLAALPLLRRQAYKAGERTAGKPSVTDRRDRALLITALAPAVLFWLAVLVGSARGLIAFGRDDLKWTGGWEYLVPFTLDGVAVSFGVLAFRAVAKERNPDRAYRIVWMATFASAGINFLHEVGGSALGAGYLAVLSLFGMLIFHEFLAQFEDGTGYIKRANPKFGMRWLTWPTNTVCAWFAWRNHPPAEGTRATVSAAVSHLDRVRADKRSRRVSRPSTNRVAAAWMVLRGDAVVERPAAKPEVAVDTPAPPPVQKRSETPRPARPKTVPSSARTSGKTTDEDHLVKIRETYPQWQSQTVSLGQIKTATGISGQATAIRLRDALYPDGRPDQTGPVLPVQAAREPISAGANGHVFTPSGGDR